MKTRFLAAALALATAACAQAYREKAVLTPPPGNSVAVPSRGVRAMVPAGQLEAGTVISLTIQDTVTTVRNRIGDAVTALLNRDLNDAMGQLVLPAGAEAQLKITAFQQPMPRRDDARVVFEVISVEARNQTYHFDVPVHATVKASVVGGRMIGSPVTGHVVNGGTKMEFTLPRAVAVR